eukprot:s1044_g16.t1
MHMESLACAEGTKSYKSFCSLLFLAGKKGKPLACNSRERTFESYVKFLEEHTNVSLESAAEEFYPQYCEVNSVPALVEELRQAAMIQETLGDMGRSPGSTLVVQKDMDAGQELGDPNVHSSVAITPIADAIREDETHLAAAPEPSPQLQRHRDRETRKFATSGIVWRRVAVWRSCMSSSF